MKHEHSVTTMDKGRESYERFPDIKRVVVKGSALYALETGRDIRLARDVDFFFVTGRQSPEIEIQYFENLPDAQKRLPPDAYETIRAFVEKHHIEDKPIQITRASLADIQDMELFEDEPELVLWDQYLEVQRKFLRPVANGEKEKIINQLGWGGWMTPDMIVQQAVEGGEVSRYEQGVLVRGRTPHRLIPKTKDLATALRLADMGERFGISVDDFELAFQNERAKNGTLCILVPSQEDIRLLKEKKVPIHSSGEFETKTELKDDYNSRVRRVAMTERYRGRGIDHAFFHVATKKGLFGFLEKQYPHLAELARKIEASGSIRDFVKNEYGEAYLTRGHVMLHDPKLINVSLPLEAQHQLLLVWDSDTQIGKLFHNDLRLFFQNGIRVFEDAGMQSEFNIVNESVAGRIVRSRIAELLVLPETTKADKRQVYEYLGGIARKYQTQDMESQGAYATAKGGLRECLMKEHDKSLRKIIINQLISLASSGDDLAIMYEFAAMIKAEGAAIKKERKSRKAILSPEGMALLRGLFDLRHNDAGKAVFGLMVNPEIDPRLKKACLNNLYRKKGFFWQYDRFVEADTRLPSSEIRWEDYTALWRVEKIASTAIKGRIEGICYSAAKSIRLSGMGIAEMNQELAKGLAPEFFLPLYYLFKDDKERLRQWEAAVSAIKSGKLQESFLYNISNMLAYDRRRLCLITDRIIATKQPTKEFCLLGDRLLKKIRFISILQENCSSLGSDFPHIDVDDLLEKTEAPSVFEAEIDIALVKGLHALTGRDDLSTDKIQTLFRAWEDPEPIFIFVAELARSGLRDKKRPQYHTLRLVGEMLAHMDPPEFTEWKQWRYSQDDPVVKEQLRGLTKDQIAAYTEDELVDLGDVIVGMLPSDKPKRIQDELLHLLRHGLSQEKEAPSIRVFQFMSELMRAAESDQHFDMAIAVSIDTESLNNRMQMVDRFLRFEEDIRLLDRLPDDLQKWQTAEAEKRRELRQLGYRGDEKREEIEVRLEEMRREGASSQEFSRLAKLKPVELADKVKKFFEQYRLPHSASPEEVDRVRGEIQNAFDALRASGEFKTLAKNLFGTREVIDRGQWYGVLKNIKAARTLLRLARLTPQLIAFDRINAGKKKETLSGAISELKKHFSDSGAIRKTLGNITEIIKEETHPIGKERLAVIFTDNPMALLTIGSFPDGAKSCQHYENGDYVLAAYVGDACTKNCLLVDLDKLPEEVNNELEQARDTEERLQIFQNYTFSFLRAAVARRLTKIVRKTDGGAPQMFLEPVYTSLDRASITRLLNAFAVSNLQPKVGIEIVRGGGRDMVEVAASRNIYQYEDGESGGPGGAGGGIGTKTGAYEMPAQPLRDIDYLIG